LSHVTSSCRAHARAGLIVSWWMGGVEFGK